MRIVVVGVFAPSLLAWRSALLRAMVSDGHTVLALAPEDDAEVRAALAEMGVQYGTVPMQRTGLDPLNDAVFLRSLLRTFRRFKADIVFAYAAKPVVYGLLAARIAKVPLRVAMITGAGSAFGGGRGLKGRALSSLLKTLYRVSLAQAHVVLFHNPDDERTFRSLGLVGTRNRVVRINGSGVDLAAFSPAPLPPGPITFLMMARLIRDKGVREFVEASARVKSVHPEVRFQLLGSLDSNPSAIAPAELEAWQREGVIEYLGSTSDVRPFLARAHVCVLPSYGEGMPRSILEAMAMGRAVLTTDVPGCRETVEPGRNGFIVAARDAGALAHGMSELLAGAGDLARMGHESRRIAEERFNVDDVNRTILMAMSLA
jgi:glycosyltransferase involved in cell wall biosynthesis